jgi:hypothetical protein
MTKKASTSIVSGKKNKKEGKHQHYQNGSNRDRIQEEQSPSVRKLQIQIGKMYKTCILLHHPTSVCISLFLPLVNFSQEGLQHCFARMIFNRSYQLLIGFALVVGKHTLYSQNMRLLSIRERKTQGQNTTMSVYPNKFAEQLIKGKLHLYTSMQSKTLVQ